MLLDASSRLSAVPPPGLISARATWNAAWQFETYSTQEVRLPRNQRMSGNYVQPAARWTISPMATFPPLVLDLEPVRRGTELQVKQTRSCTRTGLARRMAASPGQHRSACLKSAAANGHGQRIGGPG